MNGIFNSYAARASYDTMTIKLARENNHFTTHKNKSSNIILAGVTST
jgi:hypothetical protein